MLESNAPIDHLGRDADYLRNLRGKAWSVPAGELDDIASDSALEFVRGSAGDYRSPIEDRQAVAFVGFVEQVGCQQNSDTPFAPQ